MVINPIVGVYIPIIRIPIKGGMTIPNIATFDHGTYSCDFSMMFSCFFFQEGSWIGGTRTRKLLSGALGVKTLGLSKATIQK